MNKKQIEEANENLDCTKQTWDLYTTPTLRDMTKGVPSSPVDSLDKLLDYLYVEGITPAQFKKMPIYKFHVDENGFEWLKEL